MAEPFTRRVGSTRVVRRIRTPPSHASRRARERHAQRAPAAAQGAYAKALAGLSTQVEGILKRRLDSWADGSESEQMTAIFRAGQDIQLASRRIERNARGAFRRIENHARLEAQRLLGGRIRRAPSPQREHDFLAQQATYLRNAAEALLKEASYALFQGEVPSSKSYVFRNRLKMVARMESHHLMERELQRLALSRGVDGAYYHTAKDENVRATHAAHDGRFFYYSELPETLTEPGCRCKMVPAA